jgi:7-cyano-7-deazaguanine reductase
MKKTDENLINAPLGKKSPYINTYSPSLLFPVSRKPKRVELGLNGSVPFTGLDIWNAFEVSWLNSKGKPVVAIAEFKVPCESTYIVESKSFKLYLNSFNGSKFNSFLQVKELLEKDVSACTESKITVNLQSLEESSQVIGNFAGKCIDYLDIECFEYMPNPQLLTTNKKFIEETIYTDLLKSNCLVTGQPDWGSIQISYKGNQIDHESLLKYIVSLRDHNEFHEQCVERIFCDLQKHCQPQWLSVYARYTRRGGLDINPYRVSVEAPVGVENSRLVRQ